VVKKIPLFQPFSVSLALLPFVRYISDMTTSIFMNGRSQAVRLPKEFRVEGTRVSIRKLGDGVFLQPLKAAAWPTDYFETIKIEDTNFTRPIQGNLPPPPDFAE
jgi:antitoxin VapB